MASAGEEENVSGRRTRSGKKVVSPVRATRRSTRKQAHEQAIESEVEQSDIIKEMLAEAAQGVIKVDSEDAVIFDVDSQNLTDDQSVIYQEEVVEVEHQQHMDDNEIYSVIDDEHINSEVTVANDEKSSSFPFGIIGHSETSDDAQVEEVSEEINDSGVVENSLLASLVGDNANSLPSVGGCEDNDIKKEDFDTKIENPIHSSCEKMETDESEAAIAEDLSGVDDGSNATMVNTEIISEDELPLPTKPEINDAEEVSDEELPAPKRAELPADAEVISEDELPANSAVERKSPSDSPKHVLETELQAAEPKIYKRKAEDNIVYSDSVNQSFTQKKSDEQYNPMSPTSESNDAPPIEKKAKLESEETDSKDRKKDKEKEKEREKTKEKEKDRDKEKERKRLPELDKYWRAVKEDATDFTGWTYLLQYVDNESDAEAAREAYDAFLNLYPYCYGYWRKYADYEKRKGIKANCNAVFERGLEAIPLSVDLWIHYLAHVKSTHPDDEAYIRCQFERAIDACGLEFRSDKLWDAYIKWENDSKSFQNVSQIYDRLLAIPTQGYSGHFTNFQDFINERSVTSVINNEELKKLRSEIRETIRSRSSKSRRSHSKEKEKENPKDEKKEHAVELDTNSPQKDIDNTDEVDALKLQANLSDPSTITDDEIPAIKEKYISSRRKIHKNTVAAVSARWTFEEGIKRPYFHVKPLERCQLKNWKDYLDFEIEKGDRKRILVLFERCLIACALYDEFWLKMIRYLETQIDQSGIPMVVSDVFRRACEIHHTDKPNLHLMWAAFEECQNNYDLAAKILCNLESKCPNILQISYRRINLERRRGDLDKCKQLYEHYIANQKNKTISSNLSIKFARYLNKAMNDLDGAMVVLRQASEREPENTRVVLQMIDLALQRSRVDENEIVMIMDKFMARENIEPEQKVMFAQRKVEFLEDFGSTARGLQDAQRGLQIAISKCNETKKKREPSPNRKSSHPKDNTTSSSSNQSSYNNGSASGGNYNYNSTNSAYYGQQGNSTYPSQSYDNYYNHWQYSSNYSGYGQWSGYGSYY